MIKKNLFKNKRCFIVGTGPTVDDIALSLLKNEVTIGINLILLKENFPLIICSSKYQ